MQVLRNTRRKCYVTSECVHPSHSQINILYCNVCLADNTQAIFMPCTHSVCPTCYEQLDGTCPTCRHRFVPSRFHSHSLFPVPGYSFSSDSSTDAPSSPAFSTLSLDSPGSPAPPPSEPVAIPSIQPLNIVIDLTGEDVIGRTVIDLTGEDDIGRTVIDLTGEDVIGRTVIDLTR